MYNNWREILTDMGSMAVTVFENLASNAVKVITNLPGLISGKVSFNDLWTPLTDGFKVTLSQLPQIADRQAGPVEKSLQRQADRLAQSYSKNLGDYMAQHLQRNDQISKAIENGVSGAAKALNTPASPTAPNIELPKVQTPKLDPLKLDTSGAINPLNNLNGALQATKDTTQSLDAVLSGSAESMKLRYGELQSIKPVAPQSPAAIVPAAPTPTAALSAASIPTVNAFSTLGSVQAQPTNPWQMPVPKYRPDGSFMPDMTGKRPDGSFKPDMTGRRPDGSWMRAMR